MEVLRLKRVILLAFSDAVLPAAAYRSSSEEGEQRLAGRGRTVSSSERSPNEFVSVKVSREWRTPL